MLSLSIGPFALPVSLLIQLAGIATFWGVTSLLTRKHPQQQRASNAVFWAIVAGVVVARVTFVIRMWQEYEGSLLQLINLRDGGMLPSFGWGAALLVLFIASRGVVKAQRTYLIAGVAALAVIIPLTATVNYLNKDIQLSVTLVRDGKGNAVSLAQYKGKPVVINYWASWCPPCRREMPVLVAAQSEHLDVTFVFVNQGEFAKTADAFLQSQGLSPTHVYYDPGSQLMRESGAAGLPTTLFFDASGKLVISHMGELSKASLDHNLQRIVPSTLHNQE